MAMQMEMPMKQAKTEMQMGMQIQMERMGMETETPIREWARMETGMEIITLRDSWVSDYCFCCCGSEYSQ